MTVNDGESPQEFGRVSSRAALHVPPGKNSIALISQFPGLNQYLLWLRGNAHLSVACR